MLQISVEVFLEILGMLSLPLAFQSEHITESSDSESYPRFLQLGLQELVGPVQQLLFQRVRIDEQSGIVPTMQTRRPLAGFLSTITAESNKSRWLRESVLSIILRPHPSTQSNDILTLLTHLPNMRELSINTAGSVFAFGEAELAQLRNSGPSIRSLCVNTDRNFRRDRASTWPAIMNLIAAIPTVRMLDITTNTVRRLPLANPALQYNLVSYKQTLQPKTRTSFVTVANSPQFLASLGDHTLELFWPPDSVYLHLLALGAHLRSLCIQGPLKDADRDGLPLCTRLERIECRARPTEDLITAIPRTITALSCAIPSSGAAAAASFAWMLYDTETRCVAHLIQQLDTFPNLRVFSWVGMTDPELAALNARCTSLGIEYRAAVPKSSTRSLSDDEVEFSLRRSLLVI
ncbi:hypothetical protein B0H16DRAFT_1879700 [Mycena metata]|uniref:Uncharacterized protein n=1 Tax=Mycena metata TaxID=1033252 RepID=A0AAD7K478_9AGAR|nr:hypothetical protein B0H16DRAFT_1879700 [Mycena metata]